MRDMHNNIHPVLLFAPVAAVTNDTPAVSAIIDRRGSERLELILITGTDADADATFTVLVEDGDAANLSDNSAVADEQLLGTEVQAGYNFADDAEVRKIGYVGDKRYVRVTVTPANNTGNFFIAGVALLRPGLRPTANPPQ